MLNINYGHNKELMERSKRLCDYSLFVFRVRENVKTGLKVEEAVDQAMAACIREGVLADVLSKHRAEVFNLILYEYDEQKQREIERNEAREEGREEGKAVIVKSLLEILKQLGSVPAEVRSRIERESDLNVLSSWLPKAAESKSLQEFLDKSNL